MYRALAIAIGVAVLVPGIASARPRVALVAFEGDGNGEIQDVVADLLDGDYAVAGPKQTGRTIDKLGLDSELSEKDLKKLANELDADAIVRGDLAQKGPYKLLHLKLFVKGKKVRGFRVEFASAKSEKFRDALKEKLVAKLGGGDDKPNKKKKGGDEPAGDDEDPIGGKKAKAKKGGDDAGGDEDSNDDSKGGDDSEGDDNADKGDDDGGDDKGKRTAALDDDADIDAELEAEGAMKVSPHTANRAAIRVDFGPSASMRKLVFSSRAFEQAPKPYGNNVVPGGRVEGDLYPIAFGNPDSFAAGLGIGGEYDQTVGLKLRSTAQPGTAFPVEQKHWSVGARLRIVFGKKPTSPSVTLLGGYMHRMFKVDRSQLMEGNIIDLPDVFYKGFDPGLELRFPIVQSVALVLGGRAIFVTSAGQIQKAEQYGQARVTGGEGMAGLDIVLGKRFAIRLIGEFAQVGFAFTGVGQMSNNRDGDPQTPDVGGAADRYMGGALTFGVLY